MSFNSETEGGVSRIAEISCLIFFNSSHFNESRQVLHFLYS